MDLCCSMWMWDRGRKKKFPSSCLSIVVRAERKREHEAPRSKRGISACSAPFGCGLHISLSLCTIFQVGKFVVLNIRFPHFKLFLLLT